MRTILSCLIFALVPVTASAQPVPVPVSPAPATSNEVPAECEGVVTVPDHLLSDAPLIAARMSMAACAANARAETLALTDDADGVMALQAAMEPSLETYRSLVDDPHPATQLMAAYAHADLLLGMVTRMRATIPAVPAASPSDLIPERTEHDARHDALEPLIRPWLDEAHADLVRTLSVANQHPELAKDPVIAAAIRHAEADLAAAS